MTKPDPMKLEELPEIAMHGPIEASNVAHFVVGDGRKARVTMINKPGVIPNQDDINAFIKSCLTEGEGIPVGMRLMTKGEFWAHITERESGLAMPMPGNQEFEPIPVEVKATKNMLIHAILGAGGPAYEDAGKWIERGVAQDVDGIACWTIGLEKLDEAQLLEIYHEVTAG